MFDLQARRTLGRLVDLKLLSFQILLLWHLSSRDLRLLRKDLPRLSQYIDLLSRYSQEIFFLKRAKPVTAPTSPNLLSVSSLGDFFDFFHLTDVRDVKVPHLHRANWTSQRLSSHIQYIDVYGSHKYKYSMYTCALWSKDRRLIKVISLLRMLIHGWMAIPFHGKITPASTPNSFFSIFPHFCIKSLLFGFEFPPFLLLRLPSAITSTEQFLYVSRFFSTLFISPKLYLSYISIKYI